jgi:hypothetical protein
MSEIAPKSVCGLRPQISLKQAFEQLSEQLPVAALANIGETSTPIERYPYSHHFRAEDQMSKETSPKAAKAASKTMRDDRTAKASKTAAGSALSQKEKGK